MGPTTLAWSFSVLSVIYTSIILCSKECQLNHWRSDHKYNCKKSKLSDPGDKEGLPCEGKATSNKSYGLDSISVLSTDHKSNKNNYELLELDSWNGHDRIPCGLLNLGKNSCFANVILQCFSCTKPLVAFLLQKHHCRQCYLKKEDRCFSYELRCHVQKASKSTESFDPVNILSHLSSIGGNLCPGKQEDAHEFMRFAIDRMQSECVGANEGEKAADDRNQDKTIIEHIFGGRLQSEVHCTECSTVSNSYDDFLDLMVQIEGNAKSLEDCLSQFSAIEWLDGDNKFKCDICSKHVKAWKRLTVYEAPKVLTVVLKRFQQGRFGKINKMVTFPAMLDLLPFTARSEGSIQYDLYAVIVHLDIRNATFSGHYICFIKHCQGQWYRVDDSKVMPVNEDEVLAQRAYMLLYSRRTAR